MEMNTLIVSFLLSLITTRGLPKNYSAHILEKWMILYVLLKERTVKCISSEPFHSTSYGLNKEVEIVHRLSLVRISYCVKQKHKQTKVFINHMGGFVDSYSGSCSK